MRGLGEAALILTLAVGAGAAAARLHPELKRARSGEPDPNEVRLADLRTWKSPVVWVDARPDADYRRKHIPGAIHLEESQFDEELAGLVAVWAPGERIVVYCSTSACGSAASLAARLREAGFSDVYSLGGGWEAWNR